MRNKFLYILFFIFFSEMIKSQSILTHKELSGLSPEQRQEYVLTLLNLVVKFEEQWNRNLNTQFVKSNSNFYILKLAEAKIDRGVFDYSSPENVNKLHGNVKNKPESNQKTKEGWKKNQCIVGGHVSNTNPNGTCSLRQPQMICPWDKTLFRCGPIFNDVCVKKEISQLSKNCFFEYKKDFDSQGREGFSLAPDSWKKIEDHLKIIDDLCSSFNDKKDNSIKKNSACGDLKKELSSFESEFNSKSKLTLSLSCSSTENNFTVIGCPRKGESKTGTELKEICSPKKIDLNCKNSKILFEQQGCKLTESKHQCAVDLKTSAIKLNCSFYSENCTNTTNTKIKENTCNGNIVTIFERTFCKKKEQPPNHKNKQKDPFKKKLISASVN